MVLLSHIDWKFGHDKAVRKMAHNGTKTQQYCQVFVSISIHEWKITLHLLHIVNLKGENLLQRGRRQFHLLARPWRQFFGMLNTSQKTDEIKKKTAALCENKRPTSWYNRYALSRWPKCTSLSSISFLTHRIRQIWHPRIICLFLDLQTWLSGKKFANTEEVEQDGYFEQFGGSYYKQGIEAIEHRLKKCVELKGDYISVCLSVCRGPFSQERVEVLS